MIRDERQNGISDPVLAAAMAELRHEAPYNVDWDRLRRNINDRAELPLARRRSRRTTFGARPLVPLLTAASIAFALWIGPGLYSETFGPGAAVERTAALGGDDILLEALGGDLTEQEFRLLVTGRADPEGLLAVAIGR